MTLYKAEMILGYVLARSKKSCVTDIGGVIRIARECEGQENLPGLRARGLGGEFQYLNCRWAS